MKPSNYAILAMVSFTMVTFLLAGAGMVTFARRQRNVCKPLVGYHCWSNQWCTWDENAKECSTHQPFGWAGAILLFATGISLFFLSMFIPKDADIVRGGPGAVCYARGLFWCVGLFVWTWMFVLYFWLGSVTAITIAATMGFLLLVASIGYCAYKCCRPDEVPIGPGPFSWESNIVAP